MSRVTANVKQDNTWGYFVQDTFSGGAGFRLFPSREEALAYLAERDVREHAEQSNDVDADLMTEEMHSVSERIRAGEIGPDDLPKVINASLYNDTFWLEWFGTLQELQSGDSEFSRQVLDAFEAEKREATDYGEPEPSFEDF